MLHCRLTHLFWPIWALISTIRCVLNVSFCFWAILRYMNSGAGKSLKRKIQFEIYCHPRGWQLTLCQKFVIVALFFSLFCFYFHAPILHHHFATIVLSSSSIISRIININNFSSPSPPPLPPLPPSFQSSSSPLPVSSSIVGSLFCRILIGSLQ